MPELEYTYCVIQYVHDPVACEALNIGVLVYSAEDPWARLRFDSKYERLSSAFIDFDGVHYKRVMHHLDSAIARFLSRQYATLPDFTPKPSHAKELMSQLWPDGGLSYQVAATGAGITEDLAVALEHNFERFVTSQYPHTTGKRRSDEDIWSVYSSALSTTRVTKVLDTKVLSTEEAEFKFDHAFKNGRWHVLQPVSLDMASASNIQRKAISWVGNAATLQDVPELAHLYLLLGKPTSPDTQDAYLRAKKLLQKQIARAYAVRQEFNVHPPTIEIVEEDGSVQFAQRLEQYMVQHGVLEALPELSEETLPIGEAKV